jgi:hypothetical protein
MRRSRDSAPAKMRSACSRVIGRPAPSPPLDCCGWGDAGNGSFCLPPLRGLSFSRVQQEGATSVHVAPGTFIPLMPGARRGYGNARVPASVHARSIQVWNSVDDLRENDGVAFTAASSR